MSKQEKKKVGGGKLSRSETVTVRLDPKLRYLAELAARKQRRTLSSFIEWAIENSLRTVIVYEDERIRESIADQELSLWDVEEADRFARLALSHPELLTHDEQVLWKLIKENGHLWRGSYENPDGQWRWHVHRESFIFERLREHWETFKAVAEGRMDKDALPTWVVVPF